MRLAIFSDVHAYVPALEGDAAGVAGAIVSAGLPAESAGQRRDARGYLAPAS